MAEAVQRMHFAQCQFLVQKRHFEESTNLTGRMRELQIEQLEADRCNCVRLHEQQIVQMYLYSHPELAAE